MAGFGKGEWQEGEQEDSCGHCVSRRQGRQCEERRCEMGSESTVNRQVWP